MNIDPTRWDVSLTPASFAAAATPSTSFGAEAFEPRINLRLFFTQNFQLRDSRRHRQRISRKRSRLIHRAERRDHVHDFRSSAVSANRQSAADDFSQGREIRLDAVQLLRAAVRDAETGHDFVEDEDGVFALGDVAQVRQIIRPRRERRPCSQPPARR